MNEWLRNWERASQANWGSHTMPVFSHTRVSLEGRCKANVVLGTTAAPINADKKSVEIHVFTGWNV